MTKVDKSLDYDFGFSDAMEYLMDNEIDQMDYDEFEFINRLWDVEDD